MQDKTDHEMLLIIDSKMDDMRLQFDNHLHFHRNLSIAWLTIAGGLITALIIALVI